MRYTYYMRYTYLEKKCTHTHTHIYIYVCYNTLYIYIYIYIYIMCSIFTLQNAKI